MIIENAARVETDALSSTARAADLAEEAGMELRDNLGSEEHGENWIDA